jgi:hypothetical protein
MALLLKRSELYAFRKIHADVGDGGVGSGRAIKKRSGKENQSR